MEEESKVVLWVIIIYVVYYVIRDTGLWPDGCGFPRYTFWYVEANEKDLKAVDEQWYYVKGWYGCKSLQENITQQKFFRIKYMKFVKNK